MFERFTTAARSCVVQAQQYARARQHTEIGAEDLLAGVLADRYGAPARVLARLGVVGPAQVTPDEQAFGATDADALGSLGIDLGEVRRRVEETFGAGALDRRRRQRPGLFGRRSGGGHLPLSVEAKAALGLSLRAAAAVHATQLGTEHLFLGLLATDQGTALAALRTLGVTEDRAALRERVLRELGEAA